MTLPLTAWLPTSGGQTPPVRLPHVQIALSNRQPRLLGRQALTPDIDLEDYRFNAVIDWIELRLHLGRSTQAQHVQKVLRSFLDRDSHINPLQLGPGAVFDMCKIRIQEPKSLALVATIHRALVDTFGEPTEARVTGMEVSVDANPLQPSDAARASLLGVMQRTISSKRDIWTDTNSRPRSVFPRVAATNGDKEKADTTHLSPGPLVDDRAGCRTVPDNHFAPPIDGTMYLGARDDSVMIRLMDKIIDKQRPDGTCEILSDSRKRVRIEVTLKEEELMRWGVTNIPSLRGFNPRTLQGDYFQFHLPTFQIHPAPRSSTACLRNMREAWRASTYLRTGVTGLVTMDDGMRARHARMMTQERKTIRALGRAPAKASRLGSPFVTYEGLTKKVALALRYLAQREKTAWKMKDEETRRSEDVLL